MGLGSVRKKIGVVGSQVNGLGVEVYGQLKVVVQKGFLCLLSELGRHWLEIARENHHRRESEVSERGNTRPREKSKQEWRESIVD
jgi:hypothetical protein